MNGPAATLLLTGRYLITLDPARPVIEEGGVAIGGDTILAVGRAEELRRRYPGAQLIAEEHGLIMPGLVNVPRTRPWPCSAAWPTTCRSCAGWRTTSSRWRLHSPEPWSITPPGCPCAR